MDVHKAFDQALDVAEIPLTEDSGFRVRRLNNTDYTSAALKLYRANKFAIDRDLLDDNKADVKMCQLLADTVLDSWWGFEKDGKALEDTRENKVMMLTEYPAFREQIVREAGDFSNFRSEEQAEEGKDLSPDSDGS